MIRVLALGLVVIALGSCGSSAQRVVIPTPVSAALCKLTGNRPAAV